jgi:hypothetical protein
MECIHLAHDIVKVEMKQIMVTKVSEISHTYSHFHTSASSTAGPCLESLTMHYYGIVQTGLVRMWE